MGDLLNFILTKITGGEGFDVAEETADNHTSFIVHATPNVMGLIIGKSGKTVRAIRNLLRVRATLDKTGVSLSVEEKA